MITVHVDRSEIFSLSVEMQRSMQVPGITLRLSIKHRQHALPIIVSHIGQLRTHPQTFLGLSWEIRLHYVAC